MFCTVRLDRHMFLPPIEASVPHEGRPASFFFFFFFFFLHTTQVKQRVPMFIFFFFVFSFISLIADDDEPHHYHHACGHKGSSHLSPVHALQFFIAMQVQHSDNSSTNG